MNYRLNPYYIICQSIYSVIDWTVWVIVVLPISSIPYLNVQGKIQRPVTHSLKNKSSESKNGLEWSFDKKDFVALHKTLKFVAYLISTINFKPINIWFV